MARACPAQLDALLSSAMDGPLAAPTRNRRRLYEEMAAQLARSGLSLGVHRCISWGSVSKVYPDH